MRDVGPMEIRDGHAHRTLFSSWNWIDAWLRRLVGVNQLAAALKQAARWLLPSHSCCEIPLPISSTEALEFDPSRIRDNGQAKVYINELHGCLLLGIVVPRLFFNPSFKWRFFLKRKIKSFSSANLEFRIYLSNLKIAFNINTIRIATSVVRRVRRGYLHI